MRLFTSNDFEGHWPVGASAVIWARTPQEARKTLLAELSLCGLDHRNRQETFTVKEFKPGKFPRAVILQDGEY